MKGQSPTAIKESEVNKINAIREKPPLKRDVSVNSQK